MKALPLTVGLLVALPLPAQVMVAEFSPNPVAPGNGVMITFWDAIGQGGTAAFAPDYLIHQGGPTGTLLVYQDPHSLPPPGGIVFPPFGGAIYFWDLRDWQGNAVPPGTYWFEKRTWVGSQRVSDFSCLYVQAANTPALLAGGVAAVGQTTPLQIQAPSEPFATFLVAMSLTWNQPLVAFGLQTCLSAPLTNEGIVNPIGVLDGAGNSSGLALRVPNFPAARHLGLQLQALLVGPGGLRFTNGQSLFVH